jgi:hypothetical protein
MLTPSLRRQLHWTFASVKWQLDAIGVNLHDLLHGVAHHDVV